MSDLHIEFAKFKVPKMEYDLDTILVLAGDIGVGTMALPLVERCCERFKHVILVLGNHEYYANEVKDVQKRWAAIDIDNFHFLEDNRVVIDGVQFLGSTLWTDMKDQAIEVTSHAEYFMQDFKSIKLVDPTKTSEKYKNGLARKRLRASDTVEYHKNSVNYIKDMLNLHEMPTVIVTHHAPTWGCLDSQRYGANNLLNYAYFTPLEDIMDNSNVKAWISGHTHHSVRLEIYDTKVVSNARGYKGHELNPLFSPVATIEVN